MSPHPTALLGLGESWRQRGGPLPRPSISAEPGTVIPLGRPVTIVCRGPVGVDQFRLEREGRYKFNDTKDVSQASPSESEARFRIDSVSEGNTRRYRCLYRKSAEWSQRSDYLDLVVKGPTQRPSDNSHNEHAPASQGLSAEHLYILIGVSVVFLFCLLLLVLFFLHRQNQMKQEARTRSRSYSRDKATINGLPEKATINGLPEKDRETDTSAPAAGSSQEVMYAQLDHWALTRRTAQAVSPQSTEPMAESSTYAAVARH
ncbi:leukocyte-associated immunoglobulin-like receptor 1 isoform X8 [Macaca mulatta]